MARTPYATEIHDTSQKSVRIPSAGQPSFIVIHHAATESFRAVVTMELGTKQVSSTVVIKDAQVASMFDEVYRAWSLSSQYWDSVSLSSETCNSGGAAQGWPISEASYWTLARVVADWCRRYHIPCNRERIMGHREVYTRYGASYATACPGGINLDRVVSLAASILAGTAGDGNTPIEDDMYSDDDRKRDVGTRQLVEAIRAGVLDMESAVLNTRDKVTNNPYDPNLNQGQSILYGIDRIRVALDELESPSVDATQLAEALKPLLEGGATAEEIATAVREKFRTDPPK